MAVSRAPETGCFSAGAISIPYTLCRSARRRRTLSLSFGADRGLRLAVPLRTPAAEIHRLLHARRGWILRRAEELSRFQKISAAGEFAEGAMVPYLGAEYKIAVFAGAAKPRAALNGGCLEIHLADAGDAKAVRRAVLGWYRARAEEFLPPRLEDWAGRLKLCHRGLRLTNARRLWGSCARDGTIRINWRIVMAPVAQVDYLLVHELCHLAQRNHSPRFWRVVEGVLPDHKQRRKALRAIEAGFLLRGRE